MKMGKNKNAASSAIGVAPLARGGRPASNNAQKFIYIVIAVVISALLIVWVYSMGRKAEETVTVCMTAQSIYKNQPITESMLQPYDMLKGEFEKYSITQADGTKKRRVLTWDERGLIINSFAAYPLQANTYCEYRDFIKSRTDNSDNVLYSFPGKDIVPLEIGTGELDSFKTFLQPGDRVNITAIFSETETVEEDNGYGSTDKKSVDVFKTDYVFNDILIADLLNGSGESVLDIYADYREKSVYDQAQLDANQQFKDKVTPATLLVALTPEEKTLYYYYLSKSGIQFKMSLPQRVD